MAPAPTQSAATMSVEQSGARHIRDLPPDQFDLVIESIRDGIGNASLASFFGDQGWLTVSEKTFMQYLAAFKRMYPEFARGENPDNLNGIVSKRKPRLDEEDIVEQLVRVQSLRIKKGVDFEINTGIVNPNLHKDINATRELAESLAKMRGKGVGAGRPGNNQSTPIVGEAADALRQVSNTEAAQDRIASLMGSLAPLLKARANVQGS